MQKFKSLELKKYEKTIRREQNEVEDLHQACGANERQLQLLQERIAKSLNEVCRKAAKKAQLTEGPARFSRQQIEQMKEQIEKDLKKRDLLRSLCKSLFDKNYQLYLRHETLLDEEKAKRMEIAE